MRKKPPTMDLSKSKVLPANGDAPHRPAPNPKGLSIGVGSGGMSNRQSLHTKLTEQISALDINGGPARLDLKAEDLKLISELGQGNGGTVTLVQHVPTKTMMAKKVC